MLDKTKNSLLQNGYSEIDPDFLSIIKSFPTTRYYGSKKRLLPWIYDKTKDIKFDTVLDAFGGTASTSLLFNAMGKEVTFNDALKCNQVMATALLETDNNIISRKEFDDFILSVIPKKGLISINFHDDYFTKYENEWLDGISEKTHAISCIKKKSIFLYCLFQACLQKRPFNLFHRKNLSLRTNDVKRSFGNLTTWNTEFSVLMGKSFEQLRKIQRFPNTGSTVLPSSDAIDVPGKYDLVYLDPPYITERPNSDTYLKKYHFLEGLSDYENWEKKIHPQNGRYMHDNLNIEQLRTKTAFKEYLLKLLNNYKNSTVVMSYMSNAYPSQGQLTDIFNEVFNYTDVHEKELSHALAKTKRGELLFIGRST